MSSIDRGAIVLSPACNDVHTLAACEDNKAVCRRVSSDARALQLDCILIHIIGMRSSCVGEAAVAALCSGISSSAGHHTQL